MTAIAPNTDDLRQEAARLAFALIRFEGLAAHPAPPPSDIGAETYGFLPSWRKIPREEVEAFLVGLPSPALLAPTTIRGIVALTLLHEVSGERRRWFEKTISNFALGLDDITAQLGLSPTSRVLLEFDDESHVFSFAGVREWSQQLAVQVGWSIWKLEGDERATARLMLMRSNHQWFPGLSCMRPPRNNP